MASQTRDIKEISFGSVKIMVDGFAFSTPLIRHYFLTHCHSDHVVGLKKGFNGGYIYCSEVAANLLVHDVGLKNPSVVRPLKLDETVKILDTTGQGVGGVRLEVTPLSANHSPDAVMFVFDAVVNGVGKRVVHTGDFRYIPDMLLAAGGMLADCTKPVDVLYLDTTYLNKRYCFPSQEQVVTALSNYMRQCVLEEPKTLFAFMSYRMGKERAYFGAAERLNMKVYVTPKKKEVLDLLRLPGSWVRLMVDEPSGASIHVGGQVNEDTVAERVKMLGFKRGIIVRPTGWSFRKSSALSLVHTRMSAHGVIVAETPYSEHSSYEEIRACVKCLRPRKIVPTVNAETEAQRQRMVEKEFLEFMDLRSDKRRIESYFKVKEAAVRSTDTVIDLTVDADSGAVHATGSSQTINLESIDVEQQKRLFDELTAHRRPVVGEEKEPRPPKRPTRFERFFQKR